MKEKLIGIVLSAIALFTGIYPLRAVGGELLNSKVKHPVLVRSEWQLMTEPSSKNPDKLKAATREVVELPLKKLREDVRKKAATIKYVNDRAGNYEKMANDLAYLYELTGNDKYAERALWIMLEVADATSGVYETALNFFNAGRTIPPCVYAYDKVYNAPSWKSLPADSRRKIEDWFKRSSWSLLRRLARARGLHNMMPHAAQRGTGTALVLNSPELLRGWIGFCDRFISTDMFLPDGMYLDFSTSYHNQVMNHLRPVLFSLEQFRDPAGYRDLHYGIKFDGKYSFRKRWPLYELAVKVDDTFRFPDGRFLPIGDTHCPAANGKMSIKPNLTKNIELNTYGHFSLNQNRGTDLVQTHLTFPPLCHGRPYGGGHNHMNSLSLILWGAGADWLSDAGYAAYAHGFNYGNKYFFHHFRNHNTAFAWNKAVEPYSNQNGKRSRARLLAYEDGSGCGNRLQLIEASSPGPELAKVDIRKRLLIQVKLGDESCYTVDFFRLKGGLVHEFYLLQNEDEKCTLSTSMPLSPKQGSLLELLGKNRGKDYTGYLNFFQNVKSGSGDKAMSYELTGEETGNKLKVHINPVTGCTNYFTTVPNLRRFQYKNPRKKDGKKQFKFGEQRDLHLTRTRDVKPDTMTTFGAVYEIVRKGKPNAIKAVDWVTDNNAAAAVIDSVKYRDIIYSSNDYSLRKIFGIDFCGALAVLRFDHSGKILWGYVRGKAWAKGKGFFLRGEKDVERYRVVKTFRKADGDKEDAIIIAIQPDKLPELKGQWVYPELGDGSGFGVKVVKVEPFKNMAKLVLANSPVFRAKRGHSRMPLLGKDDFIRGNSYVDVILPTFTKADKIAVDGKQTYINMSFSKLKRDGSNVGSVEFLKQLGWKVNKSADNDKAFSVRTRVCPFNKKLHPSNLLLQLWDNDKKGAPQAEFVFGEIADGTLKTALGTAGMQSQGACLSICAGKTELAKISLNNNRIGMIQAGGKKIEFKSSWFLNPRNFSISWKDCSKVAAGKLTVDVDGKDICKDISFAKPGVPDRIRLTVGYGSAHGRGFLIGDTIIKSK